MEIKFRFWDGIKMTITDFHITCLGIVWKHTDDRNGSDENRILMQFTGLKDKNGVDIYEGDILENTKSSKGNFFVKFNVGGYDAVYKNNFTLCLYPILHDFEGATIIGNIYQNPELILNS